MFSMNDLLFDSEFCSIFAPILRLNLLNLSLSIAPALECRFMSLFWVVINFVYLFLRSIFSMSGWYFSPKVTVLILLLILSKRVYPKIFQDD